MNSSSFKIPSINALAIAFAIVAVGGTTLAVLYERPATLDFQSCYSEETGLWRNKNAKPGDVSQIQVETHCEGNRLVHRTRTFTKCAPRDCSWGWTPGVRGNNGSFTAFYTTYSAHRLVDISVYDAHMEAAVKNDFHDSRKDDKIARYKLTRVD